MNPEQADIVRRLSLALWISSKRVEPLPTCTVINPTQWCLLAPLTIAAVMRPEVQL